MMFLGVEVRAQPHDGAQGVHLAGGSGGVMAGEIVVGVVGVADSAVSGTGDFDAEVHVFRGGDGAPAGTEEDEVGMGEGILAGVEELEGVEIAGVGETAAVVHGEVGGPAEIVVVVGDFVESEAMGD